MSSIWGLHNDEPSLDLLNGGFVSIGWDDIPDLRSIGPDKDALKNRLMAELPSAKPGAIPVWAGVLMRFAFKIEIGDYIVYPHKADSTLNIARVAGDYYYEADAPTHRHRRPVEWLRVGVPRTAVSQGARYEVGSAVTLFRVKNHADEFAALLAIDSAGMEPGPLTAKPQELTPEEATEDAETLPNAERIDAYTRDFVIEVLDRELTGHRFEHFVAELLRAAGYRTRVTQASGDGGVDVIAHLDLLGLEPPIIKVQCKKRLAPVGGPDVQKLVGSLAPGEGELGLFVTLGTYQKDAVHIGRTRQDIRLVTGKELVDLIFAHYESLSPEWQRLIPLKQVYMVDIDPEE